MTNPIPLLKILKQVQKNIKVMTVCNLGYLMKQYRISKEDAIWILERLEKKSISVKRDCKGNPVYLEFRNCLL